MENSKIKSELPEYKEKKITLRTKSGDIVSDKLPFDDIYVCVES